MAGQRQAEADEITRRLADGTARKTYHLTREAWYAPAVEAAVAEHADHVWNINIQALNESGQDDGCLGEFFIKGHDFRHDGLLSIRVCIFHDGYPVLVAMPTLLPSVMASQDGFTYEQVNVILASLGFEDVTERERPAGVS